MLRELAEARGVTSTDVLRLFIRQEHASTIGEKRPEVRRPRSTGKAR